MKGWFRQSRRHSLAAKGIGTKKKINEHNLSSVLNKFNNKKFEEEKFKDVEVKILKHVEESEKRGKEIGGYLSINKDGSINVENATLGKHKTKARSFEIFSSDEDIKNKPPVIGTWHTHTRSNDPTPSPGDIYYWMEQGNPNELMFIGSKNRVAGYALKNTPELKEFKKLCFPNHHTEKCYDYHSNNLENLVELKWPPRSTLVRKDRGDK